jgi:integrase
MPTLSRPRPHRVSHMLADESDVKTASCVLGHASPGVTLTIYGHVLEGGMPTATDRLGARLKKIRDPG